MSLGHARPKLSHMPHVLAAREQAEAERIAALKATAPTHLACEVCGRPASYGFNYFRQTPELGVWACRDHRTEVEASLF